MPVWVMFSADATVADDVEAWRPKQPVKPLHVGVGNIAADLDLDELTPGVLARHCRESLAAAKAFRVDLDIAYALDAINRWTIPSPGPSPLHFSSHNVSAPNEMVLLSEGYRLSNGSPVEGDVNDSKYFAAIEESARAVISLREEAGSRRAHLADPPRPDLILFAPAIYADLDAAIASIRKEAPPGLA
ncbi:MAG: hypothetical protein ABL967_20890, partial [Bryobacteraceae bacterium]